MDYISLKVWCSSEKQDILIALLSNYSFHSFDLNDDGFVTSCDQQEWRIEEIEPLLNAYANAFEFVTEERVNWNEQWERNYSPVNVEDACQIRASFHPPSGKEYDIIIDPKMSFGTGHHATTQLILRHQLNMEIQGKSFLDIGCGTGVLSILAALKGATKVHALDIDEWCIENSRENFALNNCRDIKLFQCGIDQYPDSSTFDIVCANINKNVIVAQLNQYVTRLNNHSLLLLSGFYQSDVADIEKPAARYQLKHMHTEYLNDWAMMILQLR